MHCDFYVKMDRTVPNGAIFLGGSYGSFGWGGFENNGVEVAADEEVPLLGSVTANPWTYEQFVAWNGAYLKIAMEKDYFTFERILKWGELYKGWMP